MEKIKTPEEILVDLAEENCWFLSQDLIDNVIIPSMHEYGKQRHNEAIKAAAENAKCISVFESIRSTTTEKPKIIDASVDKDSILKLLEP